ncbi:Acyl transferase/acyl hydrolase/lysophospholipase [Apiospora saccharicola]
MAPHEPIALIGSACRFPGETDTPSKLWELLRRPRDLRREVPGDRYNAEAFYHPDSKHHGTINVRKGYFLDQDIAVFDNGFFNIPAGEAEAIDPQQRILAETVYDSLCAAGQTIEGLRGSQTSVAVGVMCDDWANMLSRDMELYPQYGVTGSGRSLMSNRISYFFDWHGPCMTIDTACSSSLVAVHQAIQTLHNGESEIAIAAAMYLAESRLSMLSPNGRSRMWDKDVDGYARGEGIAAIVLKPLCAAVRDNDHIECIIRGTAVNQDGRTPGLTMPSGKAQAELIRNTYLRAGLDINKPEDRPQFFHAHGTGTAAGDPQEAQAISEAFYSETKDDKLYVGSLKTIIGHTEGTAGLAKRDHSPNLHFQNLNPKLAPFCDNLEVPTSSLPWPQTLPGTPRRASLNSFGFGGTNAHAILEAYAPESRPSPRSGPLFTPLTFSASSEHSLRALLSSYSDYVKTMDRDALHHLAYSLQTRRSTLAYRVAIPSVTIEDTRTEIDRLLSSDKDDIVGTRHLGPASPKILGVFTGQGPQWARMGAKLLEGSAFVAARLAQLDEALATAPAGDAPSWTLSEMILAEAGDSRMTEAAISQPLCAAVQVVLVDVLRVAGIHLHAVVGHSSGEIGAAYAAGLVTACDAIRIAYYRGTYAKLAKSPNGQPGAMMAVGTSMDDASEICGLEEFEGRIQVAAHNSASSVTLSGDADAIGEALAVFKDEGKFARQLQVDTAYHSSHVIPCSKQYKGALEACGRGSAAPTGATWYSSVRRGQTMAPGDLGPQYWVDNMERSVLFHGAVTQACTESGPFDMVLEIGPHPALKTPCSDTIEEVTGERPSYSGTLQRGKDDIVALSDALGQIWTHLGAGSVSFDAVEQALSGNAAPRRLLADLPKYPFDHSRSFMALSRTSGLHRTIQAPPHPLLGRRCHDRETSSGVQWRNILSPSEVPWIADHSIQGQIVFPATGYLTMAVEAIVAYAGKKKSETGLVAIRDFHIERALAFKDADDKIETLVDLKILHRSDELITASYSCYLGAPHDLQNPLAVNSTGIVELALLSPPAPESLPPVGTDELSLVDVSAERFYKFLAGMGYKYTGPFPGITSIRRKADYAMGTIADLSGSGWEDQLVAHPGMLDTALQTCFAAFCCPGDERLWSLHIPKSVRSVLINPYFTPLGIGKQAEFGFSTTTRQEKSGRFVADIELYADGDPSHTFLQVHGLELIPVAPAQPGDDQVLFSRLEYAPASPDGEAAAASARYTPEDVERALDSDRICFYYLRRLRDTMTAQEKDGALPHYRHLLDHAAHIADQVSAGQHPTVPPDAMRDTPDVVDGLEHKHRGNGPIRLLSSVGQNLPQAIRDGAGILEHMVKDGMWEQTYEDGYGLDQQNDHIAHMMGQISHRYPRMNILEVGAGTGGSTKRILQRLGAAFSRYTFTDISSSFFPTAQDHFREFEERMAFQTFDMDRPPSSQGFAEGAYDVVVGSNVLHATRGLEAMMRHVRCLLKPGGYLVMLEIVDNGCLRFALPMGGLPGWWLGAEDGRPYGPLQTLPEWDRLLRRCGFGGIEASTPPAHPVFPFNAFCAQAVDERVEMLRAPLVQHHHHLTATATGSSPPTSSARGTPATQLVVVGGKTLETHRLVEQLVSLLGPRFRHVVRAAHVQALDPAALTETSAILSLEELDSPLFSDMGAGKWEALQQVWRPGRNILWVTRHARTAHPHSNMTTGVGRCLRQEHPSMSFQQLDVDCIDQGTAQLVAEHFLRLEMLDKWSQELKPDELLWSLEPEIYVENNAAVIPRLYPCHDSNGRYNTRRRKVTQDLDPEKNGLAVTVNEDGVWEVQKPSSLAVQRPLPFPCEKRTIRVTHFLLGSLPIARGARLRLCVGVDTASQEALLAAAHTSALATSVPVDWCAPIADADPVAALSVAASYLLARGILQQTDPGDGLVVLNPDPRVGDFVQELAVAAEATTAKVHATILVDGNVPGRDWQCMDQNALGHSVRKLLSSSSVAKFVDLSRRTERGRMLFGEHLPKNCETVRVGDLLSSRPPEVRTFVSLADITSVLEQAWKRLSTVVSSPSAETAPVIQLRDVSDVSQDVAVGKLFTIVPAVIHAIDKGSIFQADKTYFLVGLSGELGQSLCEWMVSRGARYVVLTSREPKVHPQFIRSLHRRGATVRILPMDVTSRDSLRSCHETVVQEMPPIAGVAHGAMVLGDALFEDMSFEDFAKATAPKMRGSQLLDELFRDAPLDFFIFFSSATAILGNSRQSNYIAGNQFMAALANQRRARGVVASTIDIGPVIGAGWVERTDGFSEHTYAKLGYRNMSPHDLHQAFAEAILVGRVGSPGSTELVTGVGPLYADDPASDHLKDVKFGHFVKDRPTDDGAAAGQNDSSLLPPRAQLATAKTKADVAQIVKATFLRKLRRLLALGSEETIDEKMTFVGHGVDSLIAVDVRSWLAKELQVDFPVLKILGGSSIGELLSEAAKSLPSSIVDMSQLEDGREARDPAVKMPSLDETPASPRAASDSTKDDVSPMASTPGTRRDSSAEDSGTPNSDEVPSPGSAPTPSSSMTPLLRHDPAADDVATCPMSFGQRGFWFLNEYVTDKKAFNMSLMLRLTGRIRVESLEGAVQQVADRHEILRTRLLWNDQGDSLQGISDKPSLVLSKQAILSETDAEEELERTQMEAWDLTGRKAVKISLLSVSDEAHFLIIGMHHAILDGSSVGVLLQDLEAAYQSKRLPPLAVEGQYQSFANGQRQLYESGQMDEAVSHYREALALPAALCPIELLPFAKSLATTRPALTSYSQFEVDMPVTPELAGQLRKLARQNQSTSFHVYLAALQVLLFRLLPKTTKDVYIGMADAGRADDTFARSLGFFLNLLPLRFRRGRAGATMGSLVQTARDTAYAALARSQVPFDVLLHELQVPRSNRHTPLFQVLIDYQRIYQERATLFGCAVGEQAWRSAATGYDVALEVHEDVNAGAVLRLRLQDTLYSEESAQLLLRSYLGVLEYVAASPEGTAGEVPRWSTQDAPTASLAYDSLIERHVVDPKHLETEEAIVRHADGALLYAVVSAREESQKGERQHLVAHLVFSHDFPHEDRDGVIRSIRHSLPVPPHLRPSTIATLKELPTAADGTPDRDFIRGLSFSDEDKQGSGDGVDTGVDRPLSEEERELADLWRQVMPLDPGTLMADSDFFLAGGNSVLLVKLQAILRKSFKNAPRLVELMGAPRLSAMAAVMETSRSISVAIDWEEETAVPRPWAQQALSTREARVADARPNGKVAVLLTGSRGYIGRHLLASLVDDARVARIYCLVRGRTEQQQQQHSSAKVKIIYGDLSQPSLGLSAAAFDALGVGTDVIIHCAGNRSFWDRYEVLRPDNYGSVRELARMAVAHGGLPLHFLSSGAVAAYDDDDDGNKDEGTLGRRTALPPRDGSDGYVSTKWAAETFLRNLAKATRTPVYIHRPCAAPAANIMRSQDTWGPNANGNAQADGSSSAVLDELTAIAVHLGLRPAFNDVKGLVHVLPIDGVVQTIQRIVHESTTTTTAAPGAEATRTEEEVPFSIVNHTATLGVPADCFKVRLYSDASMKSLHSLPYLDWFGKAKLAGFSYLITSWDLVMGSGDGELVTRR